MNVHFLNGKIYLLKTFALYGLNSWVFQQRGSCSLLRGNRGICINTMHNMYIYTQGHRRNKMCCRLKKKVRDIRRQAEEC